MDLYFEAWRNAMNTKLPYDEREWWAAAAVSIRKAHQSVAVRYGEMTGEAWVRGGE